MMDAAVRAQGVDDLARVIALFPAVGGHRATALAVGAGIHHDHAVTVGEQKLRVTQVAGAIVGNSVIEQDPIAVGTFRLDFPATENRAVSSGYVKIRVMNTPSDISLCVFPLELGGGRSRARTADLLLVRQAL